MWIIKGITTIICIILCIIGAILWIIPTILMWKSNGSNPYFEGVWNAYEKFFRQYDRNTTAD
jgi:hypothetical protein